MNSRIILCKNINLDRNYNNVLNYTESQMLDLCEKNKVIEASDYSFIRSAVHMNSILVGFTYEQCLQANYIAFQNTNYSGKWFFAWIDDVIYKGDRNTQINFKVDSWSTWFSNWKAKPCYVIREHVSDDTVGANTVPEDLNVGQIICDFQANSNVIGAESYYWFVVACNYNPSDSTRYAGVGAYGNYPQGSMWFAWLVNINAIADTINEISDWIYNITKDGHDNSIQTMFALPYQSFNLQDVDDNTHLVINGKGNLLNQDISYSKSTIREFSDYKAKNNKLYVYPYSYIRVTNNLGSYNDYKIEDFHETNEAGDATDDVTFNAIGVPCLGYSGKLRPKNYQGVYMNEDESIALGKYPTLSWSSDSYTNWLTQNAVNIGVGAVKSAVQAGTQIATGNVTGGALSIASSVAGVIGSMYQASLMPNTAEGNANAGDVSFSQNLTRFKIMHMRPKKEYLQIIDDYFSRFGYKIDRVKTPNLTGRQNWNYVEIASSDEIGYGSVPVQYMNEINQACRNGVTIWHNHDNLGNFSLTNNIV